mmetsp:Transcript_58060/g.136062  ORF Transcript_58060/g.136062 Transcript_58060/m.136062 type:complete len:307 (-) Transcript_58060:48-968(-)
MSVQMAFRALLLSVWLAVTSAASFKSIEELARAALSVVEPEAPTTLAATVAPTAAPTAVPVALSKEEGGDDEEGDDEEDTDEVDGSHITIADPLEDDPLEPPPPLNKTLLHVKTKPLLVQLKKSETKQKQGWFFSSEKSETPQPAPTTAAPVTTQPAQVVFVSKAEQAAAPFGPHGCVKAFRDEKTQTCVMKTDCKTAAGFNEFDMGFRCAADCPGCDDAKDAVVHLFGKGSFAVEETFDTKISCNRCLPLEEEHRQTVGELAQQVVSMRQNLAAVTSSVDGLQKKVISALQLRGPRQRLEFDLSR